ncbi:MAG TPA: SDR family NAD(P)-dependent oxidoreductase [Candidatus Saccharimonadales bacterium]|nr:SDR family NAD(P)-dependent oxidoreductase [Candidatus Saccharimonadales bacterium]
MAGRAFVTGASGFLGRAIVEELAAAGRPVRALARSDATAQRLAALGVEPVRGDLRDRASLEAGFAECDVVYHAAGVNAFCLPDPGPMFEVNVNGSREVVLAAAAAGVGRVVYTSSAATLDAASDDRRARHHGARRFLSNYARSKFEAERVVMAASASTGVDVVCVNPASVQGPGRTSGTARLLIGYLNGKLPAAVDGPLNVIDIADCTRGHLLAEERGTPGQRYLLCGASMTLRSGLALLSRLTGLEDPPRFLPAGIALAAAAGIEVVARARRKPTRFCREMVRTLIEGAAYDGTPATRDLGLAYTPIETTMRRTITWYLQQGLITRPLPGFTDSDGAGPRLA